MKTQTIETVVDMKLHKNMQTKIKLETKSLERQTKTSEIILSNSLKDIDEKIIKQNNEIKTFIIRYQSTLNQTQMIWE